MQSEPSITLRPKMNQPSALRNRASSTPLPLKSTGLSSIREDELSFEHNENLATLGHGWDVIKKDAFWEWACSWEECDRLSARCATVVTTTVMATVLERLTDVTPEQFILVDKLKVWIPVNLAYK